MRDESRIFIVFDKPVLSGDGYSTLEIPVAIYGGDPMPIAQAIAERKFTIRVEETVIKKRTRYL